MQASFRMSDRGISISSMKGIILAGGLGTRLWPLTSVVTKSLLPVFDKPMIYYPLTNLMLYGIRDILLISSRDQIQFFQKLLGDGGQWGIKISYAVQAEPNGIAESITIGEIFLQNENFALILGDNLIYGQGIGRNLMTQINPSGATMTVYEVANPSEYGVAYFDSTGNVHEIREKPTDTLSNWAIPGLYFFDNRAIHYVASMGKSHRGELEITDLLKIYLGNGDLNTIKLPRGTAWLDLGTPKSLLEAGEFINALQMRQGLLIGSPDETAWRMGYIDNPKQALKTSAQNEYTRLVGGLRDEE